MYHPIDVQIFNTDDPKAVYNLPRLLVREVVALETSTLMDTGYHLASLLALGGLCIPIANKLRFRFAQAIGAEGFLLRFGETTLCFCKCLFFLMKEARVVNRSCIGERGKRLEFLSMCVV